MPLRHKLLLLLASARVANLPSVVCNVWLGVALGVWICPPLPPATYWPAALQLAVSGILLYLAGNFLNDWHDRHWDARHRPERALPQGAFGPGLYLGLAICCGLAGVAVAGCTSAGSGGVAALIVGCILIYTRHHKRTAWAVLLMGSCRALLPLLFLIAWPLGAMWSGNSPSGTPYQLLCIATPALALMLYIAALSWLARSESVTSPPAANRLDGRAPLALSGLVMAAVFLRHDPLLGMLGLLPFAAWLGLCFTRYRRPVAVQISALLAGLPLLDWVFLLPLSFGLISHGQAMPFHLTGLLLPPLAVLSGRLLQRLAAAT